MLRVCVEGVGPCAWMQFCYQVRFLADACNTLMGPECVVVCIAARALTVLHLGESISMLEADPDPAPQTGLKACC